jgi:hypothetical protein
MNSAGYSTRNGEASMTSESRVILCNSFDSSVFMGIQIEFKDLLDQLRRKRQSIEADVELEVSYSRSVGSIQPPHTRMPDPDGESQRSDNSLVTTTNNLTSQISTNSLFTLNSQDTNSKAQEKAHEKATIAAAAAAQAAMEESMHSKHSN